MNLKLTALTIISWLSLVSVFAQLQMDVATCRAIAAHNYETKSRFTQNNWKGNIVKIKGKNHISFLAKINSQFDESSLAGVGVVNSVVGDIATLFIQENKTQTVNTLKGIDYLEVSTPIAQDLRRVRQDLQLDSINQGKNLPTGYSGKDVIIGVSDWGFDYNHPMFMDTSLTYSRVLAAWDQFKKSGPAPSGFNYGTVYMSPVELKNAKSDTASEYYGYATHGSHVAGIAGGSGIRTENQGVAFGSELIFVSQRLDVASAIDAFNWMKTVADNANKRLVINMSWGLYYLGTMDGTSLVSQAIDNLSNQGVTFVTSGGNNGDVNFHIKKEFTNDEFESEIEFFSYNLHENMWGQNIASWGEPNKHYSMGFYVLDASNNTLDSVEMKHTQRDAGYQEGKLIINTDTIEYNFLIDSVHPLNNRPRIQMRVKNTNTNLKIVLRSRANSGTVHYWNVVELDNGVGNWGMPFTSVGNSGIAGDNTYGVGEPACTESAITVAAHRADVYLRSGSLITGNVANFSSIGPRYDEYLKPNVSAPGAGVISSINSYTDRNYTTTSTVSFGGRNYNFASFSGTSMSSPAVAGLCALILEANPNLTAGQVKNIIETTAREDDRTGVLPSAGSPVWGRGKASGWKSVLAAANSVSISEVGNQLDISVYPNPTNTGRIYFITNLSLEEKVSAKLLDVQGNLIRKSEIDLSQGYDLGADFPNGFYFLEVEVNGYFKLFKVVVGPK